MGFALTAIAVMCILFCYALYMQYRRYNSNNRYFQNSIFELKMTIEGLDSELNEIMRTMDNIEFISNQITDRQTRLALLDYVKHVRKFKIKK